MALLVLGVLLLLLVVVVIGRSRRRGPGGGGGGGGGRAHGAAARLHVRVGLHQAGELLEVDPAVAVQVGLLDHGPDLAIRQRLAQVVHGQAELLLRDEAVAVAVEHPPRGGGRREKN